MSISFPRFNYLKMREKGARSLGLYKIQNSIATIVRFRLNLAGSWKYIRLTNPESFIYLSLQILKIEHFLFQLVYKKSVCNLPFSFLPKMIDQ